MNMNKPIVTDLEKIQSAINENQLRAVLIDPFKQRVTEVRVRPNKNACLLYTSPSPRDS
mgnify:CR=1 FL=1